jgi:hypothetical protein
MSTADETTIRVPKPVAGVLKELGKEHHRSANGEALAALTAWLNVHTTDPHVEQADTPGAAHTTEETGTMGLNLALFASMYGTLAALAAEHKRDLNGEVRAAIRAWFRTHSDTLARLEVANEDTYRRG